MNIDDAALSSRLPQARQSAFFAAFQPSAFAVFSVSLHFFMLSADELHSQPPSPSSRFTGVD
jgi:hypothetical protein